MKLVPLDQYIKILKSIPILCVDIIIQNRQGEYLLVKRANEPKKNRWWVVGGRVHKGETLRNAAIRKIKEEVGLRVENIQAVGYYELIDGASPFQLSLKVHSISVVFKAIVNRDQAIILDKQSTSFMFAKKLPVDFTIKSFSAKDIK